MLFIPLHRPLQPFVIFSSILQKPHRILEKSGYWKYDVDSKMQASMWKSIKTVSETGVKSDLTLFGGPLIKKPLECVGDPKAKSLIKTISCKNISRTTWQWLCLLASQSWQEGIDMTTPSVKIISWLYRNISPRLGDVSFDDTKTAFFEIMSSASF